MSPSSEKKETVEDLHARIENLEGERNKRLKGELAVAEAKKRVDDELLRMKSINEFVGLALKIDDSDELTELSLETIVEAFECETAAYLVFDEKLNAFQVAHSFDGESFENLLPCPEKLLTHQNSLLIQDEPELSKIGEGLGITNGVISNIINADSKLVGAIVGGNTSEGEGIFVPLQEHHISSFSIMVAQTASLQEQILLNQKVKEYVQELEEHRNLLEQRVQERTSELHKERTKLADTLDRVQQSEAKIRSIIENATDGIITINTNGLIQSFSPAAEEIFGYAAEEVTGKNVKILMPDPYQSEHDGYLRNYYMTGEAKVVGNNREVIGLRKDGSEFPMDLAVGESFVNDIRSFTGIVRDITDRKEAENQLTDAFNVISSSIDYASRIQRSVLPDESVYSAMLSNHMVLWEPRDRVGGDIYWCRFWGDGMLIILGDCTGHGVPGAFMTLIATGALDNALSDVAHGQVGRLLQRIHQLVQVTLGQHGASGESDDGMELGICYLHPETDEIIFCGARFELITVENGEIEVFKGTKSGIGYRGIPHDQEFDEHRIPSLADKNFYMTSDGLIDQVGGEKGRMFGKKRFREMLLGIQDRPLAEQKEIIYRTLIEYQGEQIRRDDVSVIGFRV